nr:uncharacterized protein LOC123844687 [Mirounga angustirostris]
MNPISFQIRVAGGEPRQVWQRLNESPPAEAVRMPAGGSPAPVPGLGPSEPSRAEPSRAEPSRAEPSRAEPSRAPGGPARAASAQGCALPSPREPARERERGPRAVGGGPTSLWPPRLPRPAFPSSAARTGAAYWIWLGGVRSAGRAWPAWNLSSRLRKRAWPRRAARTAAPPSGWRESGRTAALRERLPRLSNPALTANGLRSALPRVPHGTVVGQEAESAGGVMRLAARVTSFFILMTHPAYVNRERYPIGSVSLENLNAPVNDRKFRTSAVFKSTQVVSDNSLRS